MKNTHLNMILCGLILFIFSSCTKNMNDFNQNQHESMENTIIVSQTEYDKSSINENCDNEEPLCQTNSSKLSLNVSYNAEISNSEILDKLIKCLNGENLIFWDYCDYDLDGENEAFAITGNGNTVSSANLWFINSKQTFYLDKVSGDIIFVFAASDSARYLCISSERFENYSRIWGVQDGVAVEMPISNVGQQFKLDGGSNFRLTQSALDGMSLGGGHTHKQYYFYYDYNDKCFYEYGGTEINVNELLQFENAEKILNSIIDKGGKITSILKRNNHIININYTIPETEALQAFDWNYNITLKLNENSVYVIDENEGIYLPALVPEIAQYP